MAMDIATIKKDRLRYTNNKMSANLTYLAIIFDVLYFVNVYQSDVYNYYYTAMIGCSVICNLLFMLAAFLCSEGVKNYKISYAYVLLFLGVLQIARMFGIPRMAHAATIVVEGADVQVMDDKQFVLLIIFLAVSSAACFVAGINGVIKTTVLEKYKKEHGYE